MDFPTVEELEAEAISRTPDGDFGGDSWREGLFQLLRSIRNECKLTPMGISALRTMILLFMTNRRDIQRWFNIHTEIEEEVIEKPVFSIGMVRTGTTALSFLLDQDPGNRSLVHWQAMAPCPPPETAHLHDDPRIEQIAKVMFTTGMASEDKARIEHLPDGPAECLYLLGLDFRSGHFEGIFNIPSYHDWLFSEDLTSAYEWHKKALQLLQWRAPTDRWMIKYPSHTIALPAIHKVYPNARFIVTHRDPVKSITSVCSLVGGSGMRVNDDPEYLGRHWTDIVEKQLRRMISYRETADSRAFIDVHNDELVRNPMGTIDRIYDWMDAEITRDARANIKRRIELNPKGAYGQHRYFPEDYGLNISELRERFQFYTDHFDIRLES